jgi:hypothetical protein
VWSRWFEARAESSEANKAFEAISNSKQWDKKGYWVIFKLGFQEYRTIYANRNLGSFKLWKFVPCTDVDLKTAVPVAVATKFRLRIHWESSGLFNPDPNLQVIDIESYTEKPKYDAQKSKFVPSSFETSLYLERTRTSYNSIAIQMKYSLDIAPSYATDTSATDPSGRAGEPIEEHGWENFGTFASKKAD